MVRHGRAGGQRNAVASTNKFSPVATWTKLPDDPEFLLYVPDSVLSG